MYAFTYRRRFSPFSKTIPSVEGHSYNPQTDKMWILTPTGSFEIMKWSRCASNLGADWKAHVDANEQAHLNQGNRTT